MATVQVWDVKGRLDHPLDYAANPDKTDKTLYNKEELDGLKDVMAYAANDAKTYTSDYQHCVTGVNCSPATARQEMLLTKKQYMDDKEIVAFHGFQSFKPGEVTPELAHQIGIELAEKMWGDRFQVLVATHLNTDCIHSHFVINSTSFVDGKRYYDNKENLKKVRKLSDEICLAHGLSIIENPQNNHLPYPLYMAEKAGMPTRYNIAKKAIDEAISLSLSMSDFEKQLRKMGYKFQFSEKRKYWTVTPAGWNKPIRLNKLGKGYTKEDIIAKIQENSPHFVMDKFQARHRPVNVRFNTYRKANTLRSLYLHYCYLLGILPKYTKQNPARLHYLLKEDLLKMDYISQEVKFLYRTKIDTVDELMQYKDSSGTKISTLMKERRRLWNSLRRISNPEQTEENKGAISDISAQLKTLRKEVKMCESIQKRSEIVKVKVDKVEFDKQKGLQRKHRNIG